ncbi:MAG: tRNA lysidine(34) synthetase TilS [Thermodesulfobacteriota bacterium]|nr:tRNA lysidine(34) synthetase TilS [Thermodesulfobacteriota bacterium]
MSASPQGNINQIVEKSVSQTMTHHAMVSPGSRMLVGVSGGVDSVALLFCLKNLINSLKIGAIGVAHLNHGLRGGAADRDAAFVEALARDWGCPFFGEKRDLAALAAAASLSTEEAARNERYGFFRRVAAANGYDCIATAHHADDNAELVMMNLMRGSGPDGLAGIPPKREGKPAIIRPFINIPRKQIALYADANNLGHVEDETNNDIHFLRNRVRQHLIPLLQADYNPRMTDSLNRLARVFTAEKSWLDEIVVDLLAGAVTAESSDAVTLSAACLQQYHSAARRRVIRKAISRIKGDLRRIEFDHIETVEAHLQDPHDFSLHLPDDIRVTKAGDEMVVSRGESRKSRREFSYTVLDQIGEAAQVLPTVLNIPEAGMRLMFGEIDRPSARDLKACDPGIGLFDMDALTLPLVVRSIQPGDRFTPLGMNGTQKIKDYFINQKVPKPIRANCPVIESAGAIIWLVGHRIADTVKVTAETQRVLKVEASEGELNME